MNTHAPQIERPASSNALADLGFDNQVIELADSTRTSAEAVNAVGCEIGQIAKSLIFQGKTSDKAILIITSSADRVNVKTIKAQIGEAIKRPEADFVASRPATPLAAYRPSD